MYIVHAAKNTCTVTLLSHHRRFEGISDMAGYHACYCILYANRTDIYPVTSSSPTLYQTHMRINYGALIYTALAICRREQTNVYNTCSQLELRRIESTCSLLGLGSPRDRSPNST